MGHASPSRAFLLRVYSRPFPAFYNRSHRGSSRPGIGRLSGIANLVVRFCRPRPCGFRPFAGARIIGLTDEPENSRFAMLNPGRIYAESQIPKPHNTPPRQPRTAHLVAADEPVCRSSSVYLWQNPRQSKICWLASPVTPKTGGSDPGKPQGRGYLSAARNRGSQEPGHVALDDLVRRIQEINPALAKSPPPSNAAATTATGAVASRHAALTKSPSSPTSRPRFWKPSSRSPRSRP